MVIQKLTEYDFEKMTKEELIRKCVEQQNFLDIFASLIESDKKRIWELEQEKIKLVFEIEKIKKKKAI